MQPRDGGRFENIGEGGQIDIEGYLKDFFAVEILKGNCPCFPLGSTGPAANAHYIYYDFALVNYICCLD